MSTIDSKMKVDKIAAIHESVVVHDGDHARVALRHKDFSKHGEKGEAYRKGLASEMGWPYILSRYREHANDQV